MSKGSLAKTLRSLLPRRKEAIQPVRRPRIEDHPLMQSDSLNQYIGDRLLRTKDINFYSAFELNHEAVRIRRFGYHQPAWEFRLYLRDLYHLFMHCLTARALGCADYTKAAEQWFEEDIPFLRENREHHFGSRLAEGKALLYNTAFLRELADMRERERQKPLPWDGRPYHVDVFPYDCAAPEEELLQPGSQPIFDRNAPVDPEVEAIIVELVRGPWG